MRVRRARPGDEEALRAVRLHALADAPREFDSTLEREESRPIEDWRRWIEPGAVFLLEDADGTAVGVAAGVDDDRGAPIVYLAAMWVHPSARGTGGADALVQAVLEWADSERAGLVRLHVVRENRSARRLYERCGFRVTGEEIVRPRDGVVEYEMRRP